jgi:hypothetical protein
LTHHNYSVCSSEEEAWAAWEAAWKICSVVCLEVEAAVEEEDHVEELHFQEVCLLVSLFPLDQVDLVVSQEPQVEKVDVVLVVFLFLVSVCE